MTIKRTTTSGPNGSPQVLFDHEVERARAYVVYVDELLDRVERGLLDDDSVEWISVADAFMRALDVLAGTPQKEDERD